MLLPSSLLTTQVYPPNPDGADDTRAVIQSDVSTPPRPASMVLMPAGGQSITPHIVDPPPQQGEHVVDTRGATIDSDVSTITSTLASPQFDVPQQGGQVVHTNSRSTMMWRYYGCRYLLVFLVLVAIVVSAVAVVTITQQQPQPPVKEQDKDTLVVITPQDSNASVTQEDHNSFPKGPYIPADYSERIVLPQLQAPPPVYKNDAHTNTCPHHADGLLDFHETFAHVPNGADITLPVPSRVVVRRSWEKRLGLVTIPAGSALVLGEHEAGIRLDATGFDVQGELVAGSETCLIQTDITIALHGSRPDDAVTNIPAPTVKGISVTGSIYLHGKRYFRTWTRLAATAAVGHTVLMTQHAVNWEPGQEIVLTTTALKDSREWHQNEVHRVLYVDSNITNAGSAVYLQDTIHFRHIANEHYQAEVGLLTRKIKIQGADDDSEPTDPDPLDCTTDVSMRGDTAVPCSGTELTGYGAHLIVHGQGRGTIDGVEFYRVGQTNVLGRYPVHFHLLGDCPECYLRASSIHRSYYRCVAIHATHHATVTENVAYDVTGFCYYLESGIEENNEISFNLAALIHAINPDSRPPGNYGQTSGQTTEIFWENDRLTLPADVVASGFYISNSHNNIIGNAASGGWAGFNFPHLGQALKPFRDQGYEPSASTGLIIDGNTAHSSGWWWEHAGSFYFGGALYYNDDDVLEYSAGRTYQYFWRTINVTNTKAFLSAGVGLNSWSGPKNIMGWESHDTSLSLESLSHAFWVTNALAVCRTGEQLVHPDGTANAYLTRIPANGLFWYDTWQEHIITHMTFRNCGFRSDEFSQYDDSDDRGCDENSYNGCSSRSSVFSFLTHSDEFTPQIMQATKNITFENCGRRFSLDTWFTQEAVSYRHQNWLDADGSVTGLGKPSFIVSGAGSASTWWHVDDGVVYDSQGPLRFILQQPFEGAPLRGLGAVNFRWDDALHARVGKDICGNGLEGIFCETHGYMRHAGKKFSKTAGIPLTPVGDMIGLVSGFGWILKLNGGAPKRLKISEVEVLKNTPLLISIAYPVGTSISIKMMSSEWCSPTQERACSMEFKPTTSIEQVRKGPGDEFFVDSDGVVTFRVAQTRQHFIPLPWRIPEEYELDVQGFERDDVYLPRLAYGPYLLIDANCESFDGVFCSGYTANYDPDICPPGYEQYSYDTCCSDSGCVYANGNTYETGSTHTRDFSSTAFGEPFN